MAKILEVANRNSSGGRRKIKMALHTIHEDLYAQPNTLTNDNGLHWKEEYTLNNLDSLKGIPICSSLDDNKEVPIGGHGLTEVTEIDGKKEPLFEDSEIVGVIEEGKIEDVFVNGSKKRMLVGYGWLFVQRIPNFVQWLRKNILVEDIKSSIEIMGTDENNRAIIYEEENPTNEFRTPKVYNYSGTCILYSVKEADENCIVIDVAQKINKEELDMGEKELKQFIDEIKNTINETNSKNDELNVKIGELNSTISEKNDKVTELETSLATMTAELEELKKKYKESCDKNAELEKEISACKQKKKQSELNEALKEYSDEEKKCVEVEINEFNAKENPTDEDKDAIISKICRNIVATAKEKAKKVAEINSKNENIDIYSYVDSVNNDSNKDNEVDIFGIR